MSKEIQHEEVLFHAALALETAAQRQAFLDHECGKDIAMKHRIQQLLAASQSAEPFFLVASQAVLKSAAPQSQA